MKALLGGLGLCLAIGSFVSANDVELVRLSFSSEHSHLTSAQKRDDANRQRCSGMYGRKSWGGQVDPFILVNFMDTLVEGDSDPLVSLVMFEWNDEGLIGRRSGGRNEV